MRYSCTLMPELLVSFAADLRRSLWKQVIGICSLDPDSMPVSLTLLPGSTIQLIRTIRNM